MGSNRKETGCGRDNLWKGNSKKNQKTTGKREGLLLQRHGQKKKGLRGKKRPMVRCDPRRQRERIHTKPYRLDDGRVGTGAGLLTWISPYPGQRLRAFLELDYGPGGLTCVGREPKKALSRKGVTKISLLE